MKDEGVGSKSRISGVQTFRTKITGLCSPCRGEEKPDRARGVREDVLRGEYSWLGKVGAIFLRSLAYGGPTS